MRTPAKLAMTAAVLVGLSTVATGGGTYAAFSSATQNTGNSFSSGTVSIEDNDGGTAMFSAANMRPGDPPQVGCIRVTYTGSIAGAVRLHATTTTTSPTSLANHLEVKVERGTQNAPAFDSCTVPNAFTVDPVNHKNLPAGAAGNGVLYDTNLGPTTLANFPGTYAAGITDPNAAWTSGESHMYRVTVSLPASADNAAQGLNATTSFTWEAQTP